MRLLTGICTIVFAFAFCDMAQARTSRSHSHSSKPTSGYIVRHCKTEACFKKHPSGTYAFKPGEHKRK